MMTEHDMRIIQDNLAAFTRSAGLPAQARCSTCTPTYSDDYIEYWAVQYRARRIWRYGILFGVFVERPREILDALTERGFLPLLPEQKRVQQRLDEQALSEAEAFAGCKRPGPNLAQAPAMHGDRYIQPMRPRRWLPHWKVGGGA